MSEKAMMQSKEIYKQLGGNKFALMTGAKNFGYSETKEGSTNLTFQNLTNTTKKRRKQWG